MPEKKADKKKTSPTKVTSVRVDAETHRRARIYAAVHGTSLQEILGAALDDYLKKKGA